jgi:hypothetical protein
LDFDQLQALRTMAFPMVTAKQYLQLQTMIDYIVIVEKIRSKDKVFDRLAEQVNLAGSVRLFKAFERLEKKRFDIMFKNSNSRKGDWYPELPTIPILKL